MAGKQPRGKAAAADTYIIHVEGVSPSRESTRTSALAAMQAFLSWCSRNGEPPAAGTGSPGSGGGAPSPAASGGGGGGGGGGGAPSPAASGGGGGGGGASSPAAAPDAESDEDEEEEAGEEGAPAGPASWGYPLTFAAMTEEQVCRVVLWQRFYFYLRHKARWGAVKDREYKFSVICDYARTVMLHARKVFVGEDLCNPKSAAARHFFCGAGLTPQRTPTGR
jgi:hypothetical protein